MSRFVLRVLFVIAVPLGLMAAPATAKPDVPTGCDLLNNTHCHCLSPGGLMDCTTID